MFCVAIPSRRSSTASESKKSRGKSRARSKSPFRSFRWKKSKPPAEASPDHYSDDEENLRAMEGSLGKIDFTIEVAVWGAVVSCAGMVSTFFPFLGMVDRF